MMSTKMALPSEEKRSTGPSLLKQSAIQISSGGSAGFIEICIMYPMDLVKTRFQLQVKPKASDPAYYTGIRDCMRKMYLNEGLGAFWKGIVPPMIVETPVRAAKFFAFEQCQQIFLFGASAPTPLTFLCAGLCGGIVEGILVNPFEVVKVQLQSNRDQMKKSPSTIAVTKAIIRKNGFGLNGLNKGLTATVMRHAVFNSIYFGFYLSVKGYIPQRTEPLLEFLTKFGIGLVSGTLASCVNIPFDVAKSRIQGPQPVPGEIKYKGTLKTIAMVYRNEGFKALYKGLLPKILRLGPGGAITIVVYEYVHVYLTERFKD